MKIIDAIEEVEDEFYTASEAHGEFASAHEGFAVLKEEVDELWDEIKLGSRRDSYNMKREAVQVAAMALRFLVDIC